MFAVSRAKNSIFPYTGLNSYITCVYAGFTTTTRIHWEMCPKLKNGVEFPCHVTRSMILGLPYTGMF
jgi:hypothetical protein